MTIVSGSEGEYLVQELMTGDGGRWPLYARASFRTQQAHSVKVEWSTQWSSRCPCCGHWHLNAETEYNYQQIFSTSFNPRVKSKREALAEHLDEIETALRIGVREETDDFRFLGGVLDLLGHWPRREDTLKLSVLRPTQLLRDRGLYHDVDEFVTELSLIAIKGEPGDSRG